MKRSAFVRKLSWLILPLFIGVAACQPAPQEKEEAPMSDPALKVANEMVAAWNDLDLDRIIALFAEDGVLHSVMIDPIVGRENLREHIGRVLEGATRLELKIKNTAVVGDTVILERVDDFEVNGRPGAVPVVGVLVIKDGFVAEWREYYDRAQLLSEMGASHDYAHGAPETDAGTNIEVYQDVVAAWRRKDVDAVMERFTDDIEFHSLVGREPHRGKADVRKTLEQLAGTMSDNKLRVVNFEESGDSLLVEGVEDFVDSEGRRIQIPYMGAYKFKDGKISRWRDYFDPAVADGARAGEPMSAWLEEIVSAGDQ